MDVDYYIVLDNPVSLPNNDIVDLRSSELVLRTRAIKTCPLMLLEGTLAETKARCRYDVINAPIPKGIIKLNQNSMLLTNLSKIFLTCNNQNYSGEIIIEQLQVVYHLKCGCSMLVDGFYAVDSNFDCDENINITPMLKPRYILNVPLLSQFIGNDFWISYRKI